DWPEELSGFEDLAFLFSRNTLHMGMTLLAFDQASYLYRVARRLPPGGTAVEIGRFKGGGTFVIASALPDGAQLWSYDLQVKMTQLYRGEALDAALRRALARYAL